MGYKEIQSNKILRGRNGVRALQIERIDKENRKLYFSIPTGRGRTRQFTVTPPDFDMANYEIGQSIDFVIRTQTYNGHLTSFRAEIIGKTPEAFAPVSGSRQR